MSSKVCQIDGVFSESPHKREKYIKGYEKKQSSYNVEVENELYKVTARDSHSYQRFYQKS